MIGRMYRGTDGVEKTLDLHIELANVYVIHVSLALHQYLNEWDDGTNQLINAYLKGTRSVFTYLRMGINSNTFVALVSGAPEPYLEACRLPDDKTEQGP
jgi:hypothetical protein